MAAPDPGGTSATGPSPLQQRVTELEQQLAGERQKHGEARQLLQRTELATRSLETRTQHDALTQQEELDGARQATVRAQRALDDTVFEAQQHDSARRTARASLHEQPKQEPDDQVVVAVVPAGPEPDVVSPTPAASAPPSPKKRGRPRTRLLPEPKPVRWWTPSYKAGAKTRS